MKFKITNNIFDVSIDDKKIVLDSANGEYFELNSTGSEIFDLLKDSPRDSEEIFHELFKKYSANESILRKDISHFLRNSNFITEA